MKERTEVPVEQTWDLSLLFKTEEDYKKSIEFYKQLVENFCKNFENQLSTVEAIHQSLADYREILELRGKIVQYASLAVNANTKDREAQNRLAQTRKVVAECDATLSFFSPELSQLEEELLAEASKNPENSIYLERLLEDKQHLLSKEVESVLAALGNTLDFPYQNYNDIKFKDVGLLIIDEEQKFGVKAKEKLKKIKGDIDVLTLTATPIPRTLNLSLLGIRDLSVIDTSPEGRQKIQTEYIDNNKNLIKEIILSEISREGQVFYIFNSVKRMENKVKEIRELLPEYIKVDYIHGQMLPRDIKKNIQEFENGNVDVLVATTIIENGIDIENANTMIIEGVEKLGLSQVYQLRGRIGRSTKKSYCYMLMNENKTKNAKKREESIREFDNLTGIDLAMEDSKIRGVGEILGEKQHGAVETFGYNLYMKMLNEEILKLKEYSERITVATNMPSSSLGRKGIIKIEEKILEENRKKE